tara:strand:+ start:61 stop:309 length:249 start_codon:yes stop_codon:yes gene_type:complete
MFVIKKLLLVCAFPILTMGQNISSISQDDLNINGIHFEHLPMISISNSYKLHQPHPYQRKMKELGIGEVIKSIINSRRTSCK